MTTRVRSSHERPIELDVCPTHDLLGRPSPVPTPTPRPRARPCPLLSGALEREEIAALLRILGIAVPEGTEMDKPAPAGQAEAVTASAPTETNAAAEAEPAAAAAQPEAEAAAAKAGFTLSGDPLQASVADWLASIGLPGSGVTELLLEEGAEVGVCTPRPVPFQSFAQHTLQTAKWARSKNVSGRFCRSGGCAAARRFRRPTQVRTCARTERAF